MARGSRAVQAITGTEQLWRWNVASELGTPAVVTYSFASRAPKYETFNMQGLTKFSPGHKDNIRKALDLWAEISGLTFVEVPQGAGAGGQMRFSMVDLGGQTVEGGGQVAGRGAFPGYVSTTVEDGTEQRSLSFNDSGGDVWLHRGFYKAKAASLSPGQDGFYLLLHEIGHALGFKHPFEGSPTLPPRKDNGNFTVMSYERGESLRKLGSLDEKAVQLYYGEKSFKHSYKKKAGVLEIVGTKKGETVLGTELKDVLKGKGGADTLRGELKADKLSGNAGADVLFGGAGKDRLFGNGGDDRLVGEAGMDRLVGGRGRDLLEGEEGADTLIGGPGNDTLEGGAGADLMTGGSGADTFRFVGFGDSAAAAPDRILDFRPGQGDRIDLSRYADEWFLAGGLDFTFIGSEAFSGWEAQLRVENQGADTLVLGDAFGAGSPDLVIRLVGVTKIDESAFIL